MFGDELLSNKPFDLMCLIHFQTCFVLVSCTQLHILRAFAAARFVPAGAPLCKLLMWP